MSGKALFEIPFTEYAVELYPGSVRKKKVFRPIVPLTLLYKGRLVQCAALLDSGADYNVFHADIATYLGIPVTKGSKIRLGGVGEVIKGYVHKISLRLGSYMYESNIVFSNQLPGLEVAILGMQGFFSEFTIMIRYPISIRISKK